MAERCDQCLYGPNRIVSKARFQDILSEIEGRDCHFICHKATIVGRDVCCRGDWDVRGGGKVARIAKWLKQFVEIKETALTSAQSAPNE